MKNSRVSVFIGFAMSLSTAAVAAPNTSIDSPAGAARSVLSALDAVRRVPNAINIFGFDTRNLADRALRLVAANTTYEALRAAPRGIVVACPVSGTLYARLSRGVPRVLRIEHSDCVVGAIGRLDAQNGPIEIVLGEASLAPSYLLSIRLGDASRDHVVLTTPTVGTFRQDAFRNLRLTGVLPNTREEALGFFPGRFTVDVTGFADYVYYLPDVGGGQPPSVERYPQHDTYMAEHLLVTGEHVAGPDRISKESRILWGRIDFRQFRDATPRRPVPDTRNSYIRGWDLKVVDQLDPETFSTIDGRMEVNISERFILGCTGAETYTAATPVPLRRSREIPTFNLIEAGELRINGSTNARFAAVPAAPSPTTRVTVEAPGIAAASYDMTFSIEGLLSPAATCAP